MSERENHISDLMIPDHEEVTGLVTNSVILFHVFHMITNVTLNTNSTTACSICTLGIVISTLSIKCMSSYSSLESTAWHTHAQARHGRGEEITHGAVLDKLGQLT